MNTSIAPIPAQAQALVEQARALQRAGREGEAEAALQRALQLWPEQVEAATALARYAMERDEPQRAAQLLQRATEVERDNPNLLKNLGVALRACGRLGEARVALENAVAVANDFFPAWIHLGLVREELDDRRGALVAYFRAVTRAQLQGHWLSDETLPPWLRDLVLHAMDFVQRERRELFFGLLTPLRERFGAGEMRRVERCISGYLKELSVSPSDPRQFPRFLLFPDIPAQPYCDKQLISWTAVLEECYPQIRAEAEAVLGGAGRLQPFLEFAPGDDVGRYLKGAETPPAWDAFFFYRHGVALPDNQRRCPQTHALLESLPLARIREHAPEICFSVLTAGTHILPHTGVTNVRLVVHLPLIVPRDCAIKVGGEEHVWREGEAMIFDDTFEHEAWNRSDSTRVILLMDAWNPHLSEAECLALTSFIETIGDLDRGWM